MSNKSRLVALLLCIFLGWLGAHRYYVGKIGSGLLWMFTGGCFYIGWIIDIIFLACGKMTDKDGDLILDWDGSNSPKRTSALTAEANAIKQPAVSSEPWGNGKEKKKSKWYGMLRIIIGAIYLLYGLGSFLYFQTNSLLYIAIGIAAIVWGAVDRTKNKERML